MGYTNSDIIILILFFVTTALLFFVIGYFIRQKLCQYELEKRISQDISKPTYDPQNDVWYSISIEDYPFRAREGVYIDRPMVVWHIMNIPQKEKAVIYDSLGTYESYNQAVKVFKEIYKSYQDSLILKKEK